MSQAGKTVDRVRSARLNIIAGNLFIVVAGVILILTENPRLSVAVLFLAVVHFGYAISHVLRKLEE